VRDAALVPAAAVLRGTPGTYVYLLTGDDKVAVRPIEIGESDGVRTVVTKGLAVGDRVVVDGTDRLKDGAQVRVTGGRPEKAAGPEAKAAQPAGGEGAAQPHQEGQRQEGQRPEGERPHRRRQQSQNP
jgi:multidrug efflux system membrane fusion protein